VKGDYLGEFEQIILLALIRLRDQAYGMTIRQEIEKRTGRQVSIGAAYATLDRLEEKGYVTSYLGAPTATRGGRSKRYFKLTSSGAAALNRSRRALEQMWAGVDPIGEGVV
jgi:DNA-binding PadR family transcriptional regulator